MRIAYRGLLRAPLLNSASLPRTGCLFRRCIRGPQSPCRHIRFTHPQCHHSRTFSIFSQRDDNAASVLENKFETGEIGEWRTLDDFNLDDKIESIKDFTLDQRRDPRVWMNLLEAYVPVPLSNGRQENIPDQGQQSQFASRSILAILDMARSRDNFGSDILAHMIINADRKSGLWLCSALLTDLSSQYNTRPSLTTPSNLLWPPKPLDELTKRGIHVLTTTHDTSERCEQLCNDEKDPRYLVDSSSTRNDTMNQIWLTLGSLAVQSANMPEEQAQKTLNAVHLILSQIHNRDLVPENVYDYRLLPHSAAVGKPPIVHLVSSRILTTISDASWREHQNEIIEKAASDGTSYREIGRDPPGGRFRLKVRPMGPEVWLEFILWCCVEGGFTDAGARIIDLLRRESANPWFAITWSTARGTTYATPHVDWARVKSRSGGTVGRIEGYSREKPLADVPSRTISTEVVLALVEAHIESFDQVSGIGNDPITTVQDRIVDIMAFLEPHDLPTSYFDYIVVRLMMTNAASTTPKAQLIQQWVDKLSFLRSLNPVQSPPVPRMCFQLEDLMAHSEFAAGLRHQLIDAYVQDGNIHEALRSFDTLQQSVDNSKLHAIESFLQKAASMPDEFFSSRPMGSNPDFVESHGQLPPYKLAGLLNLATDANLIGFGQWMLYNEGPDGPLIPRRLYNKSSLARALVRFAGTSNDEQLLDSVLQLNQSARLSTVNFLRSTLDAYLTLLDIDGATKTVRKLGTAKAGGFGLNNLTHLAGTILKLESTKLSGLAENRDSKLHQATHLFNMMLAGHFDGRSGVLQRSIRTTFQQQIGHLLTLFQAFPESSIASFAKVHQERFLASNVPNLSTSVFNTFLDSVIQTKDAVFGMELVDLFCTDISDGNGIQSATNLTKERANPDLDGRQLLGTDPVSSRDYPTERTTQLFIPFTTVDDSDKYVASRVAQNLPIDSKQPIAEIGHDLNEQSEPGDAALNPEELTFASPFFRKDHNISSQGNLGVLVEKESINCYPICKPDVSTIRLVARAAMKERRSRRAAGAEVTREDEVLEWVRTKLELLGHSPLMVVNEIREPVSNSDVSNLRVESSGRLRKKAMQYSKAKRTSRISKVFRGKNITRN